MVSRIWFNRICAVAWVLAGIVAFPLGWAYTVAFVTIASVYANAKTDWSTAEAADNREVMQALAELRREVTELRGLLEHNSEGRRSS